MEARGDAAVAHGDSRISRYRDCRSDARDYLEFHTGGHQFQGFFAATAEHERIAALEARNHAIGIIDSKLHQKLVDFGLFDLVVRRHLAHVDHLGFRVTESEDCGRNEAVVHHHVGFLEHGLPAQSQESRITRTRTNQINSSTHCAQKLEI